MKAKYLLPILLLLLLPATDAFALQYYRGYYLKPNNTRATSKDIVNIGRERKGLRPQTTFKYRDPGRQNLPRYNNSVSLRGGARTANAGQTYSNKAASGIRYSNIEPQRLPGYTVRGRPVLRTRTAPTPIKP